MSIAAPLSRLASFPAGQVTIRDIAGSLHLDNTLLASVLTGPTSRTTSSSAKYFNQVPVGTVVNTATLTNAGNIPDYNYDQFSGVTYDIDIAQPWVAHPEPVLERHTRSPPTRSSWWR